MSVAQLALLGVLRVYQVTVSPVLTWLCAGLGCGCRFSPTCSQYAVDAIREHGCLRGVSLAAHRLARCHPWGKSGYDPVPPNPCSGHRTHRLETLG